MTPHPPMQWIVRPGIGLGDLRFGSEREEVRLLLGNPEDISERPLGYDKSIAWYYWELGVSAHFCGEDGFRLGTLQVERQDAELFEHRLIGLLEHEVREILGRMSLGAAKYEVMEFSDFPTKCRLVYQDQGLNFWFKHNRLEAIQWGYLFGANDEVLWP
jgi:hypothetical protein